MLQCRNCNTAVFYTMYVRTSVSRSKRRKRSKQQTAANRHNRARRWAQPAAGSLSYTRVITVSGNPPHAKTHSLLRSSTHNERLRDVRHQPSPRHIRRRGPSRRRSSRSRWSRGGPPSRRRRTPTWGGWAPWSAGAASRGRGGAP